MLEQPLHLPAGQLCARECAGVAGDCARDLAGTWSRVASLDECRSRCAQCAGCGFVSYSPKQGECLWSRHCPPPTRAVHAAGFETFQVKHQRPNVSSHSSELSAAMLSAGVLGIREARLACVVQTAARRPLTIAALGGSVTAGFSYRMPTSSKDQWTYPSLFAGLLAAHWPVSQREARGRLLNLGIPATGPTMFALCLPSLLPSPPDLVLLEFGINADATELPLFRLLLQILHKARVATIVVNVQRYGPFGRRCKAAHCRSPADMRLEPPDSQAGALEALATPSDVPEPTCGQGQNAMLQVWSARASWSLVPQRWSSSCR